MRLSLCGSTHTTSRDDRHEFALMLDKLVEVAATSHAPPFPERVEIVVPTGLENAEQAALPGHSRHNDGRKLLFAGDRLHSGRTSKSCGNVISRRLGDVADLLNLAGKADARAPKSIGRRDLVLPSPRVDFLNSHKHPAAATRDEQGANQSTHLSIAPRLGAGRQV